MIRLSSLACSLAFLLTAVLLVVLASTRYLDPDELAHLEFAFLIHDGMVPYRDFFEHHSPLLHILTAPLFALVPAATDADWAARLPLMLRGPMIVLALLHIPLLLALTKGVRDPARIALLLMLPATGLFIEKGIEFRPDPLAGLALGLAVLGLLRRDLAGWLLAGFMTGLAFVATPKSLLVWPGMGLAALVSAWGPGRRMGQAAAAGIAGFLLPPLLLGLWLCHDDALKPFLDQAIFANSAWPVRAPLAQKLTEAWRYIPLFLTGALVSLAALVRIRDRDTLIRILPGLSVLAAIVPMPLLSQQFFYWPLPLLAAMAAPGLDRLTARARPAVWVLCAGLVVMALWPGRHPAAIDLPHAADVVPSDRRLTLEGQQAELAAIVRLTRPDETVWAGWWTILPYRRPALFWFFLHGEIRRLLTESDRAGIAEGLESGRVAPRLISYDRALQRLATEIPSLGPWVKARYEPTGIGDLWRRKD